MPAAPMPSSGVRVWIGRLDLGNIAMTRVEGGRRHHHHGHVDQAGEGKRDHYFAIRKIKQLRRSPLSRPGARAWVRPDCR